MWLGYQEREAFFNRDDIKHVLRKRMGIRDDGFKRLTLRRATAQTEIREAATQLCLLRREHMYAITRRVR